MEPPTFFHSRLLFKICNDFLGGQDRECVQCAACRGAGIPLAITIPDPVGIKDKLLINLNISDYFYIYFAEDFERSTTKGRENVAFELELKKQNTKNKVMSPYLMIIGAMRNCGI